MNNIYLCGAEDKDPLVVLEGITYYEDCNFVELISAPSRGTARKIVAEEIYYGEFTSPMTIRKICETDTATGILTDVDDEVWTLAWGKVGNIDIPKR